MDYPQFRRELAKERERFRTSLRPSDDKLFARYPGRIGVVLSGGGARGAYEAGALLAFHDAHMPTHILAATSVGSINAAFYAAHSRTLVGNAEPLVDSWAQISSPAVGIDWSRYIFMLAGLVAATAGFFNAIRNWSSRYIYLHADNPVLTWLALMFAGAALLLLYDQLPYIAYVALNYARGGRWKPDALKAWRSLAANFLVWGFAYLVLNFTHLHIGGTTLMEIDLGTRMLLVLLLAVISLAWFLMRARISRLSHQFLRLPLRTGLFPNYERTKFLRSQIPAQPLRDSPIRVVMTATDLAAGNAKYFTNASVAELRRDPQVNQIFASSEIEQAEDLLQAVVASSAFTIAYEAVPMQGRLWTDGGVVTNQPIRPAVRLGADVLFLVMVDPVDQGEHEQERTFLDVGLRALSILVAKNLAADLKLLGRVNRTCEIYAADLKLRPEEIQLEFAEQSYKYVKAFTICPENPLAVTQLDFDASLTMPAILQGYRDGARAVAEFADYLRGLSAPAERRRVRLVAQRPLTANA
jgi:predicted acylesterase/phospholipase RssA